ncbi:MAG: hypothetical protein QGG40_10610, partial [Myxococcota bacterium]|nr:hypothetical protein [Myxococcota bacterium]
MGLLVLPLESGSPPIDESVRKVLREFLTTMRVSRYGASLEQRPPEPVRVVPGDSIPWRSPAYRSLVDGELVLLSDEDTFVNSETRRLTAIRTALDRMLRHEADARHCADTHEKDPPGLLIMPVLALPERLDATEVARQLERIAGISRTLDSVAESMSSRGMGRDREDGLFDLPMAVVPWLFVPRPPRPSERPSELFCGPANLGIPKMYPVLYTGVARGGQRIHWSAQGGVRLLADLFFLHAISGSRRTLERLFPEGALDLDHRVYTFHSALYEYPLREKIKKARLDNLVWEDSETDLDRKQVKRILPRMDSIGSLAQQFRDEVASDVAEVVSDVHRRVEEKALPVNYFHFDNDGGFQHEALPDFYSGRSFPTERVWQGMFDDARWSLMEPPRQADVIHDEVLRAVERCASFDLDDLIEEQMSQAKRDSRAILERLEGHIGRALNPMSEQLTGHSLTVTAVGRTTALMHGVRSGLRRFDRPVERPPDPHEAIKQVLRLRDSWIKAEEALLDEGRYVASKGAFYLELGSLALMCLALCMTPPYVLGLPAALGLYWIVKRRMRVQKAYYGQWVELNERFRAEAKQATEPVAHAINARAYQVKAMAARDLLRSLDNARVRFETEVRGFTELVTRDLADLQRLD